MDANLYSKILRIKKFLSNNFVEREGAINTALVGLFTGEPTLMVAPPGTGKTQLIEILAKLTNSKYFYYLLTRFTEPDELLGPYDIKGLREGRFERITTNKLPDSEIVFLDEIFKASSAIRNILLDIMLFKRVPIGTSYKKIPMLAFYTASNEVSMDEEDQGFLDRLTIRSFFGYVSLDSWSDLLIKGVRLLTEKEIEPILNSNEIRLIQNIAYGRMEGSVTNTFLTNKYLEVLLELKQRGINLSDRRKVKTLLVASGYSLLYSEDKISLDSLADAIRVTAPTSEDDLSRIEEAIVKAGLSSYNYRIRQIQTISAEIRNVVKKIKENNFPLDIRSVETLIEKASTIVSASQNNNRLKPYIEELKLEMEKAREIIEKKWRAQEEYFGRKIEKEEYYEDTE